MKHAWAIAVVVIAVCSAAAQNVRPAITGFARVAFYTSSPQKAREFYRGLLGLQPGLEPNEFLAGHQTIKLITVAPSRPGWQLARVGFATPDAEGMRRYLAAHGVKVPASVEHGAGGVNWFSLTDPEGTPIEFVQEQSPINANANAISSQIIHVGFVVHDRAAEDRFYRDLLGFKLYWHGGMQAGRTDWVAMQVPDGRQWIEYMMVEKDAKLDAHLLGVLNHFSLGVRNMNDAAAYLTARGWKPTNESKMQMGKDGKWQLNVYDPDDTRVELMEFKPVQKPCCAEFTAPHPEL